jgi:HAE1 family hydrophobic/amphiphilic exporter-1
LPRNEAILKANEARFRPIMMTTIMLVAAMIPIATGTGPGAGARASMAKVILGGQMLSLLLSLLVTPVAYSLWDDLIVRTGRIMAWFRRDELPLALPLEEETQTLAKSEFTENTAVTETRSTAETNGPHRDFAATPNGAAAKHPEPTPTGT